MRGHLGRVGDAEVGLNVIGQTTGAGEVRLASYGVPATALACRALRQALRIEVDLVRMDADIGDNIGIDRIGGRRNRRSGHYGSL